MLRIPRDNAIYNREPEAQQILAIFTKEFDHQTFYKQDPV